MHLNDCFKAELHNNKYDYKLSPCSTISPWKKLLDGKL